MHRSAKLCLYGLAVAGLVAGAVSAVTSNRSLSVNVDGQLRHVHTSAATVAGVLHSAHLRAGSHDVVAPGLSSHVRSGMVVELRRGRLLRLSVDGVTRDVWTTDLTVDSALADLGYGQGRTAGVSRSKRLPLTPTALSLSLPKRVTILADGKSHSLVTTASSVQDAVGQSPVLLGRDDLLAPSGTDRPTPGMKITVTRVKMGSRTVTKSLPYSIRSTKDTSAYAGTTHVVHPGRKGRAQLVYQLVYFDGKLAKRILLVDNVVSKPVTQTQTIGTRSPEADSPAAAKLLAKSMVTARGWDDSQYQCLVLLWTKESGWRTNAANPSGAYGIPQSLPGSKMATAGPNWQTNAKTQITWGLNYISRVYNTPCGAWAHSQATNWY